MMRVPDSRFVIVFTVILIAFIFAACGDQEARRAAVPTSTPEPPPVTPVALPMDVDWPGLRQLDRLTAEAVVLSATGKDDAFRKAAVTLIATASDVVRQDPPPGAHFGHFIKMYQEELRHLLELADDPENLNIDKLRMMVSGFPLIVDMLRQAAGTPAWDQPVQAPAISGSTPESASGEPISPTSASSPDQ
ncbi:MAG: hypothetical protein GC154_00975 [bacterium]|nr:hypothetical protein [bacterium]